MRAASVISSRQLSPRLAGGWREENGTEKEEEKNSPKNLQKIVENFKKETVIFVDWSTECVLIL